MSQVEVLKPEQWPVRCQVAIAHKDLYEACRKLAEHPDKIVRFPLNGVDPAKASKKAHWYFRNFLDGNFKIKTGRDGGFMCLRKK